MRGKWAAGIEPRSFTWVYKGILAVSERPGGSTTVHRRVRRDEELLWLKHQGFGRVISILPVMQNLSAYFEHGLTASHYALRGGPQQCEVLEACYLDPVSYTHLDVYKRQPLAAVVHRAARSDSP